jgi:hypothetical protein
MLNVRSPPNTIPLCPDGQKIIQGQRDRGRNTSSGMEHDSYLKEQLEELRRSLSEPFRLTSELELFFKHPVSVSLVAGREESVRRMIDFAGNCQDAALIRVAVLLLSQFPPAGVYDQLLKILGKADKSVTLAFEPGLWLIDLPAQRIAEDLVCLVAREGNPFPLLLLQRPIAKEVRSSLERFIRQREMPVAVYALYAYGYALEPSDTPLLEMVSSWIDNPELAALAGVYLLRLGNKAGLAGVKAGLMSCDEELRAMTYYELSNYLPPNVTGRAGYDPTQRGDSQGNAVSILLDQVGLG